jgi:putative heme-binding domain-containing protein
MIAVLFLSALAAAAQSPPDFADGRAIYRSNCAFCHGLTGRGGRGPALVGRTLMHGSTDEDLRAVIRGGVPGTTMPAFETMEPDELDRLVAFIRHMGGSASPAAEIAGDPARGRQIYQRTECASCHRVGDRGSVYGPDLTRIGAARSLEYLRESLLAPSADILQEYEGVTVVTGEGKQVTGIRVNEDNFTVQLRDASQQFRMFVKNEVSQVKHEAKSLMPAYGSLPPADLQDLLAYLGSLRGSIKAGGDVRKADGIR